METQNGERRLSISIVISPSERKITRVCKGDQWRRVTIDSMLTSLLLAHERSKQDYPEMYEREHGGFSELQEVMSVPYRISWGKCSINQDELSAVKLEDLLEPGNESETSCEVCLRVERQQAPSKQQYRSKYEMLREEMTERVHELVLDGLFVGNMLEKRILDPRVFEYLPGRYVNELITKANSLLGRKDYTGAYEIYQSFAQAYPDNSDYKFLCAKALMMMNQHVMAMRFLQQASELGNSRAGEIHNEISQFRERYSVYPPGEQIEAMFRNASRLDEPAYQRTAA